MVPQRHVAGPHARHGQRPKLTLAGRLEGELNKSPFSIVALDRSVTLRLAHIRSAFTARRCWQSARPLLIALLRDHLSFRVQVGRLPPVPIRPGGLMARLLAMH